ncbi:MAG: hypothetical protein IJH12_11050 [Clostridia bacterium]|nr:hypothetical protein [Clostridia bacterium]
MEEMDVIIIKKILLARIYKYAMLKRLNILNKSNEKDEKLFNRLWIYFK